MANTQYNGVNVTTLDSFESTRILRPDDKGVNEKYMERGETAKSKCVAIAGFYQRWGNLSQRVITGLIKYTNLKKLESKKYIELQRLLIANNGHLYTVSSMKNFWWYAPSEYCKKNHIIGELVNINIFTKHFSL